MEIWTSWGVPEDRRNSKQSLLLSHRQCPSVYFLHEQFSKQFSWSLVGLSTHCQFKNTRKTKRSEDCFVWLAQGPLYRCRGPSKVLDVLRPCSEVQVCYIFSDSWADSANLKFSNKVSTADKRKYALYYSAPKSQLASRQHYHCQWLTAKQMCAFCLDVFDRNRYHSWLGKCCWSSALVAI